MKRSRKPEFDWEKLPVFAVGTPVRILPGNIVHIGHVGVVDRITDKGVHVVKIPLMNPTKLTTHWEAGAMGDCLEEYL